MPNVFGPALEEMETTGQSVFGPISFRDYCKQQALDQLGRTADLLSVDHRDELKEGAPS